MSAVSFDEGEDGFVLVSVVKEEEERDNDAVASHDPCGDGQAKEACSRPSRSRVRSDSATRRQRRQQAEVDKSSSTVVLVTNLRDKCHEHFRATLIRDLPANKLTEIHLNEAHNFGFLVFADLESMNDALLRLADLQINGTPISLSRCAAVTLWRNPRVSDDEQPCDTLALKGCPPEITMSALHAELRALCIPEPTEAYFNVSPTGTFSGTVILRFASVEIAQRAHACVNSTTLLGRQLRAEYKRSGTRAAPRTYHAPCRESETLFARLKEFKSSTSEHLTLTTKMMSPTVREQLVLMASFLGLRALSDGDTPRLQLTLFREQASQASDRDRDRSQGRAGSVTRSASSMERAPLLLRPSVVTRTPSLSVSCTPSVTAVRAPRGPDGTRGFRSPSTTTTTSTTSSTFDAATSRTSPRDSGLARDGARSAVAVLAHTLADARPASSDTWRRAFVGRRLTGTS